MNITNLDNSLPVRIMGDYTNPLIRWVEMSGVDLSEAFFDKFWVNQIAALSDKTVDTDLDTFIECYHKSHLTKPNGFIFHMSRCGSTLLTNMLRRITGTIAHSEPSALDPVFTILSEDNLEKMIRIYSSPDNMAKNYVVKFPSYATLKLSFFNKAFPDTPKLFLYRNPVDVLMSNLKDPTQEWIYTESIVGESKEQILSHNSVIKNVALGLENTCKSFLDQMDDSCFCLNYSQLIDPETVSDAFQMILDKFGFEYNHQEMMNSLDELNYYSKDPFKPFSDFQKRYNHRVSEVAAQLLVEHLYPVYQQLEDRRIEIAVNS